MCVHLSQGRLLQPGCLAEGHERLNSLFLATGLPSLRSFNHGFGSSWFI